MGISDRIILTLYTIVMAAFAVALVLTTLGMIPAQFFMRIITALPGNWEFAAGGVVIFLFSVRLLLAGIGVIGDSNTLTLADVDSGKTVVSKRALEEYIGDIAQEVYGIYGVKVVVETEDKTTINARIHASLEPGVNVFEITEEVKDNVKETIKKVVGLEVKNIELYFKKIKNNGKEKG
ncbi:MAG: alkaline shock response membrane anchor protein AmaP [Acidaminococcaceae bacterium]|nr:alkaline shock response membrane anchor protein AmaP [Acidaminococcaceae bacterium]MBR1589973.1 alkaline shock response membrane anchor protein AmaP [Acidaminococcaceae bacterium]